MRGYGVRARGRGVTRVVHFEGETYIERPPEVVFDFVADERNSYDPAVSNAEKLTDGPIGVGTRFRSESASMRRRVEMTVEITEYERPRRLGSWTHTSSMDIRSTLTFEAEGAGTRMRWASDLAPRGAMRLLTPLIALTGRRRTSAIWEGLKRTLEGEGDAGR